MATVLITGGTGMVGKHLTELLVVKGYDVIIVSRKKVLARRHASISYALWDVEKQTIDTSAIANTDYIIHLAGANVTEKRWSNKRKNEIINSRTQSSKLLVKALTSIPNKVKAVVSASAIGYYGPDTKESLLKGFNEESPVDNAYLGETCRLWEESIEPITSLGIRLIKLRIGIVLSKEGGALHEFMKPLKWGVAAILGKGKQVISWIHQEDLSRMFVYALENEQLKGAYNAVSSCPVTNKELTLCLARLLKGTSYIPIHVPTFMLNIILGEMSIEVLKSATVNNYKIKNAGFNFKFSEIETALKEAIE